MATVGNTYLSLADALKRQDPNHEIATIIEILNETNPILNDMPAIQCNDGTGHITTVRSGLPRATWRKLYQGVQPSKSTTKQVKDTTGMLEAWSEVDSALVKLSGEEIRLTEATTFLESMNQEMATGLFYHDTATDPEKFMGLAPRFNDPDAETGEQLVNGGGTGSDNTSIWFIVWGDRTVHGLYPKGTTGGLSREDKGKTTKENSDGSLYDVHREKFEWHMGLSVRDWRYISRVCNIDVSALTNDAATGADLQDLMLTAYYKLYQRKISNGRAAIYCNTTVKEYLHKQMLRANSNTFLRMEQSDGQEVMAFMGMPIREVDAITDAEAAISFS